VNILAVFPHPDDEIGCAATLAHHAASGDSVTLVWTTYGELASHFAGKPHAEVKAVREGHARHVAELIGAQVRFFDFGDTRVSGSREQNAGLACLYAELKPDAIITWDETSPGGSSHPDHRATARSAFDAITLARLPGILAEFGHPELEAHRKPVRFYQYGHYSPPQPGWPLVHISVSEAAVNIGAEILEFYAQFYGWKTDRENYIRDRKESGTRAGVEYADKYFLRRGYHPALERLI